MDDLDNTVEVTISHNITDHNVDFYYYISNEIISSFPNEKIVLDEFNDNVWITSWEKSKTIDISLIYKEMHRILYEN